MMKRRYGLALCALLLAVGASAPARAQSAPAFRVMADVVASQICIPQSIFAPGDTIVFRAEVDDDNGVRITADQIKARGITAVVTLKDGTQVPLRFGIHPPFPNVPATDTYWGGAYYVKPDHPTGTLPWSLTVSDSSGAKATFTPIGQPAGLSVLTIAVKGASPPKS